MTKRLLLFLSLLFLSFFACIFSAFGAEDLNEANFEVDGEAGSVYFYSYNADRVLYSRGANERFSPGASAKMMTGLIACEMYSHRFAEKVTISSNMLEGVRGASMNLRAGMTVTVKDLFWGTVCGANNDAAQVLAIALAGSVEAFVSEMNFFASHLYMKNTHYKDPTGFDDKNSYTTLEDIAILSKNVAKNTLYLSASSSQFFELYFENGNSYTVYNRNALVSQFSAAGYTNKHATGLCAGLTDESGYVLSSIFEDNGEKFLCVIINAKADGNKIYSYEAANALFDSALYKYSYVKIANAQDEILNSNVSLSISEGASSSLPCVLENDLYIFVNKQIDVKKDLVYKPYLHSQLVAPISEGTVVGGLDVYCDGILLARTRLIAGKEIKPNAILATLEHMKSFFLGRVFILTLIFSTIFLSVYLHFDSKRKMKRRTKTLHYKKFS